MNTGPSFRGGEIVGAFSDIPAGFGRFNWIDVHMARLDPAEMREFIIEAWRMVVPEFLAAAQAAGPQA